MSLKKVFAPTRQRGSQYQRHLHQPGDVVRWGDKWGVCAGFKFAGVPLWDWFDEDGEFIDQQGSVNNDISAPYDLSYVGIPEAVLVRSVALTLEHS